MKKLYIIAATAIAMLLAVNPAFAQTKVAVISQEIAVAKSKVGAYAAGQLKTIGDQIDTEFEPELAPLRTQAQQLNAEVSALSPDVLRTRSDLLRREQDLRQKLGELLNWKQRQMAATQQQAFKPILAAYETAVNAVIAEKNVDVLLDGSTVLFRNKNADITEAVVAKIDAALTTTSVTRVRVPRVPPQQPAQ